MQNFRSEAIPRLKLLADQNLYDLAHRLGTHTQIHGRKNKGWVGQTLEHYLGLKDSNLQKPDGTDFELKSTSLVWKEGHWAPKETIKVTQMNPAKILLETFETSSLWLKLSRLVFVGVHHESDSVCKTVCVSAIDVNNSKLIAEIETFWSDVRSIVANGEMKDFVNLGTSEGLLQLRPTGDGKYFSTCPITGEKYPARAFYATKRLIERLID